VIPRALLQHLRRHVVGYVALFVALGGTSYAALDVNNHSIDPVKLNPRHFGGYVRAWASVAASGRVIAASSRKVRVVKHRQPAPPADYDVFWHVHPTSRCVALVNVDASVASSSGDLPGTAVPQTIQIPRQAAETTVRTYDGTGQLKPLPFDVALLCSIPH
jgi:hypothetical protein